MKGDVMMTPRQQEIVDQAIAVISRRGIQALTIRNIADGIGISEPAIYRHFASKTDVLLAILDALEHEIFGSSAVVGGGTAVATITSHFARLFDHLEKSPDLAAVVFSDEVFMNDQRLAARVRDLMERSLSGMEGIIHHGQRTAEFRADVPAMELALMMVGTIRLIVRRWHLSGFSFELADRGTNALDSFIMLIASPA
jgi:AcrR family transcriptional regulator